MTIWVRKQAVYENAIQKALILEIDDDFNITVKLLKNNEIHVIQAKDVCGIELQTVTSKRIGILFKVITAVRNT